MCFGYLISHKSILVSVLVEGNHIFELVQAKIKAVQQPAHVMENYIFFSFQ